MKFKDITGAAPGLIIVPEPSFFTATITKSPGRPSYRQASHKLSGQFVLYRLSGKKIDIRTPAHAHRVCPKPIAMEENKEKHEKENLKDKVEDIKNQVTDKAGEFAADAKEKAESFAGKTLDAAEKLLNDVFKKNKPEDADYEEEKTDPKDIEIAELKRELEEQREKYIRLYADFDNAKKRMAREKQELFATAGKDVLKDLLPVLDDFERAQKAVEKSNDITALKEGLNLVYSKLTNTLNAKGLKAMDSVGKEFDVNNHEAITEIPAPTPDLAGKVIDEVEKGYYLNDKIIRFAKVVVGK